MKFKTKTVYTIVIFNNWYKTIVETIYLEGGI